MRADVVVVGAGPAGSTAARLLAAHHEVLILEEHKNPGEPLQCAGLVTGRGVPAFARGCVIGAVRGARIHSPLGFALTLEGRAPKAYVIDRAEFDRTLFHKAVDEGAVPMLSASVTALSQAQEGVRLDVRTEEGLRHLSASVVVGADGYRSACRRSAALPPPKHMLTGIQVELKGVVVDPDYVELYLGEEVAPGFFAWAIPAGDLVRVGLCTWDSAHPPAAYLKRLLRRPEFAKGRRVSAASGKIPIGPGRTAVKCRVALVGDAACHAKPLSGGGVFTGIRGAELCARAVAQALEEGSASALAAYDALWKDEFGRELVRAFRIRKVFLKLSDEKLDKALRIFAEPDIKALLESKGDIDYPASLSSAVLKLAPKLAQFSPQLIESLL